MIKTFCEGFKRKSARNRPGLILKTSHATFSIMDRFEIEKKIQDLISFGIEWLPVNKILLDEKKTKSVVNFIEIL